MADRNDTPMGSGTPHPSVFVREATGLVREVGWKSAMITNLSYSSAPLSLALLFSLAPAFYLGGNMYLAVILSFLLAVPIGIVFAMFASAIPRSGGDYTWVSRSLAPVFGLMSNWSFMVWLVFVMGAYGVLVPEEGIAPTIRVIAADTKNPHLLHVATFFTSTGGEILVGGVLVVVSGAILVLTRGLRTLMRVQNWNFVYWILFAVIIPPVIVLTTGHATFVAHFNSYVSALGGQSNAYAHAIKAGAVSSHAFNFGETLLLITIPYYALGFIYMSVYFAGEIKRGGRGQMLSIPGAQAVTVLIFMLVIFGFSTGIGNQFLGSLGSASPHSYGLTFAPVYPELAAIASGNLAIGLLIVISYTLFLAIFVPISIVIVSRSLFAWSFDRLIPEWISKVNPRTHSPVNAVVVIGVLVFGFVVVFAINASLTALVVLLGQTITYISVGAAAVIFPFRKRDVFEAAPYNNRWKGIPLMSILGGIGLVFMLLQATELMLDANSGTAWVNDAPRIIIVVVVWVAAFPVFYIARGIQRRRGVDIDLAYKEIPPE